MSKSLPTPRLEALLNDSVDGVLSETDEATLQKLLLDDPAARRRYLHFMQLHAELHWDHGAAASLLVSPKESSMDFATPGKRFGSPIGGWVALAIAVGTVAAGLLWVVVYFGTGERSTRNAPNIATLEMTQGTVSFQTPGSESRVLSLGEQSLPAGTLVVEGESSAVQWRFLDGTLITVSGDAEVSFSDVGQKMLRVRQGLLTAEVQPQPANAPLIVETSTARVEVLGTVFTLAAEAEVTRVNVDEGLIRMRRLVDGQTVEVPKDKTCVASLDARDDLRPVVPREPVSAWRHRFTQPPPERWKGEWLPAEGDLPARVRAVPCMVGRKHQADYTPIVHYGVTARKADGISLGLLPVEGLLKVRFRTRQPARLQIMLGLHHADGRFGGNFEIKLPRDFGTAADHGWRELMLPLADFHSLVPRYQTMPAGSRPYLILLTTYEEDAGLEVCELAIVESEGGQ